MCLIDTRRGNKKTRQCLARTKQACIHRYRADRDRSPFSLLRNRPQNAKSPLVRALRVIASRMAKIHTSCNTFVKTFFKTNAKTLFHDSFQMPLTKAMHHLTALTNMSYFFSELAVSTQISPDILSITIFAVSHRSSYPGFGLTGNTQTLGDSDVFSVIGK